MTDYFEIRVLPDAEISPWHLMAVLFSKVHLLLAEGKSNTLGVSFPEYDLEKHTLGRVMRVHGTREELSTTMLKGLRDLSADYFEVGEITPVPSSAKYRRFSRKQSKSSPERIRRRMIKRQGITEEEARKRLPDEAVNLLNLPFIQMKSLSTGERFRLFIEAGNVEEEMKAGEFTCYGLSSSANVPWF